MFAGFAEFRDQTALVDESGETFTYAELEAVGQLFAAKIPKRSLVLSLCQNSPASIMGYCGFLRARMVQLLLNDNIDPDFLITIQNLYAPEYAFVPAQWHDVVGGEIVEEALGYRLINLKRSVVNELHPDLALLLATSGSTGNPKMVRISVRNVRANTQSIMDYLPMDASDRAITTMPMAYSYGLSIINSHLSKGASIVTTTSSIMNKGFWDLMQSQAITTFGGVPYLYEMLKKLRFERIPLPKLRYITQAGGKMTPKLAQEFSEICRNKRVQFYIMYGQTEATARMAYHPVSELGAKFDSIGKAIPGGRFWIADAKGSEISEPFQEGELCYEGENVSMGYAESGLDLKAEDQNQGRLLTGDIACRDEDGDFFIVGRKRDFVKVFGLRINVSDIESLLKAEQIECACVGRDDALWVFYTDKARLKDMELTLTQKTRIPKNGFRFVSIDEIPRSSAGKPLYSELTSRYTT